MCSILFGTPQRHGMYPAFLPTGVSADCCPSRLAVRSFSQVQGRRTSKVKVRAFCGQIQSHLVKRTSDGPGLGFSWASSFMSLGRLGKSGCHSSIHPKSRKYWLAHLFFHSFLLSFLSGLKRKTWLKQLTSKRKWTLQMWPSPRCWHRSRLFQARRKSAWQIDGFSWRKRRANGISIFQYWFQSCNSFA